jgi:hypothetical protein
MTNTSWQFLQALQDHEQIDTKELEQGAQDSTEYDERRPTRWNN